LKNFFSNLAHAARNWRRQLSFGVAWAAIITIGVALSLNTQGWHHDVHFVYALIPFAVASFVAGYSTPLLAQTLVRKKPALAQFSFFFAALCIFTVGLAALIFAIHYRMSFPQWSAHVLSVEWITRTFFTVLSAAYLFSVVGFRLLMPWGLIALFVVSIGFSRGWFQPSR
jgi:hypothetical protein